MNKLDPQALFSIFEQGDEEVYREHNVAEVLKNPYVLMGMAVTGIENFHLIDKLYTLKHKQEYQKVRDKIKYKYYSKIYLYLSRITLEEVQESYGIGDGFDVDRCLEALNELLEYFQSLEQYERCATILKYTDLLYGKKLEVLF